ncbi:MAG: sodium:solute symporter [Saprospiraceae bacterium]|nr:sodium:solute symporter [Saprospiraceae bacterium]
MTLSPVLLLSIIAAYFLLLMAVSWWTGRKAGNAEFFIAGRKSPWLLVAIGMIGASLSGVTFISIPGVVGAGGTNQAFAYMQLVVGYVIGYFVIAHVLMPIYYRLNLISIYGFLEQRFGYFSYKTGAAYFLLSRVIGASFRLFLVAIVLQKFIMDPMGVPFWLTVATTILLIWVYTFRGGIKTIVWTDTLQTVCMLTAVVLTILAIGRAMDMSLPQLFGEITGQGLNKVFFFEGGWADPNNFFKQVVSGALITIVMTGLDQDMMQKNLTCRNIREAQKNMFTFSSILVVANLLFLTLGALLYIYAAHLGVDVPERTDQLYPTLALTYLPPAIGVMFLLGLTAAAYSSADSALTSLTTAFCVDFLDFEKRQSTAPPRLLVRQRWVVHMAFSVILFGVILFFNTLNNEAVINQLFVAAGYTYGPLLGLFAFGIFTRRRIRDNRVIAVCLIAPVLSYLLNTHSDVLLGGFELGFLILAVNGLLTYLGLWMISYRDQRTA